MKKTLIRTLVCIAGAAIIAALGRACNNEHTIMPNKPSYPMQVYSTELLTIYDITDCPLDLACGQMPTRHKKISYFAPLLPSQANASITLNIAISSDHISRADCYTKDIQKIKTVFHSQSDTRCLYGKVMD